MIKIIRSEVVTMKTLHTSYSKKISEFFEKKAINEIAYNESNWKHDILIQKTLESHFSLEEGLRRNSQKP